jgi:hypothetical protein
MFADGQVDEGALSAAKLAAHAAHFEAATAAIFCPEAQAAACAFYSVASPAICTFAAANRAAACVGPMKEAEQQEQCRLFRDILGNPFRPATLDSNWRTAAVVSLAHAAYEERSLPGGTLDSNRLAILADALEDAGCTEAAILEHLRSAGSHVRGCHVLDLVLDRT